MAYLISWSVTFGFAALAPPRSLWCFTKDVESASLPCAMRLTMRQSRASFLITAAHFRKHHTGRIGNEHESRMGTELNDTEEAHHGRKTIFTRKTRSR